MLQKLVVWQKKQEASDLLGVFSLIPTYGPFMKLTFQMQLDVVSRLSRSLDAIDPGIKRCIDDAASNLSVSVEELHAKLLSVMPAVGCEESEAIVIEEPLRIAWGLVRDGDLSCAEACSTFIEAKNCKKSLSEWCIAHNLLMEGVISGGASVLNNLQIAGLVQSMLGVGAQWSGLVNSRLAGRFLNRSVKLLSGDEWASLSEEKKCFMLLEN